MTTSAITPEVLGHESTELFLDTDLTPTELARVESLETKLRMSDATVLEQKIMQGETLFRIQQERLYRSRKPGERFTWGQYLEKFTPDLTKSGKGYKIEAAQVRQLMYLMHSGKIWSRSGLDENLPLPSGTNQMLPLLGKSPVRHSSQGGGFDLDGDWTAFVAIWKGANSKQLNPDRQAVAAARSTYEANQLRSGGDPGRMMSPGKQASIENARSVRAASPSRSEVMEMANHEARENCEPRPFSPQDFSPANSEPAIPAWQLEKHDDSVDAGSECKRITQAMNDAFRALATLRGILYSQTNKYGSEYMGFLRQVDAGVYSLNNIDDQIQQMGDDIAFISELLVSEVGEGELAKATLDVEAIPTR